MNDYDYIAAIDCECEFIRSFQPGELMNDIWESKSFLTANKTPNRTNSTSTTMRDTAVLMGLDGEQLRHETEDYQYLWWFNEIPVYRTDTLKDFFSWLNENSRRDAVFNNWCCFDYYIYVMWLIECKGFKLTKVDITFPGNLVESLCHCEKDKFKGFEREHNIHWTSRAKVRPEDSSVVMKCQLDHLREYNRPYRKFKRAVKYILISLGLWRKD